MLHIYICYIYSWKVETINQLTFCPLCLGQSSWAAPKYQTCAGCLSPTLDLSARRPFEPAFSCAQHILGDCGTPKGRTFVSFIHISSLSPALKCLAILTLARSWSSLVRFSEFSQDLPSLWSIIEPLPSRVDPKWMSEWQMHHRGLNWYLKQHEPQPSAIFEISGQFIRVISITSNLFHCRVADFQNLLKEWKQRRHFLRQFVPSPLTVSNRPTVAMRRTKKTVRC